MNGQKQFNSRHYPPFIQVSEHNHEEVC